MEHEKFVRMYGIARKAGNRAAWRQAEYWKGFVVILLIAASAIYLVITAAGVMHSPANVSMLNATDKFTAGLNATQIVAKLAGNSTALARFSYVTSITAVTMSVVLSAFGILLYGAIVGYSLDMGNKSLRYKLALKDARRDALLKAGYSEKDISEFREQLRKYEEVV